MSPLPERLLLYYHAFSTFGHSQKTKKHSEAPLHSKMFNSIAKSGVYLFWRHSLTLQPVLALQQSSCLSFRRAGTEVMNHHILLQKQVLKEAVLYMALTTLGKAGGKTVTPV